jgi:hypothetical protein
MVNMPRWEPKKKFVMPAQPGIQVAKNENVWIRAWAGMIKKKSGFFQNDRSRTIQPSPSRELNPQHTYCRGFSSAA